MLKMSWSRGHKRSRDLIDEHGYDAGRVIMERECVETCGNITGGARIDVTIKSWLRTYDFTHDWLRKKGRLPAKPSAPDVKLVPLSPDEFVGLMAFVEKRIGLTLTEYQQGILRGQN